MEIDPKRKSIPCSPPGSIPNPVRHVEPDEPWKEMPEHIKPDEPWKEIPEHIMPDEPWPEESDDPDK